MRGFKDNIPPISYKFNYIKIIFEELSYEHSVDLIDLPLVEQANLYFRTTGEESEICNKELFEVRKYKGEFEDWVLRPEATASCVRALKESHFLEERKVCRLGYYGPMFRYNRPQKGRYRQFNQAGWEWLGSNDKYTDLELILAGCNLLETIGIEYTLEINSIGDVYDRKEYRRLLKWHLDIEGDPFKILDKLEEFENIPRMEINERDDYNFNFICDELDKRSKNYVHNPYLVRGLDYYNGIVFEFKYEGKTILAGGRYDGLMQQLGGKSTPAIGFALGVDRVVDIFTKEYDSSKDLVLISLNENEYANKIAEKCRKMKFRVHPFWGMTLGQALKIASKEHKNVIIIGENERSQNKIIIKDLDQSKQKEIGINEINENMFNKI